MALTNPSLKAGVKQGNYMKDFSPEIFPGEN
jgi:hypothetical protein